MYAQLKTRLLAIRFLSYQACQVFSAEQSCFFKSNDIPSGARGEKKRPYFCIITAFSSTKFTALWEIAKQKVFVSTKSSVLWHVNAREKLPCRKEIMRAVWHHFSVARSLFRVSSQLQSGVSRFEGLREQYSSKKSFLLLLSPPSAEVSLTSRKPRL